MVGFVSSFGQSRLIRHSDFTTLLLIYGEVAQI